MKYINKLGKKNLVYVVLCLVLAVAILLAFNNFKPIHNFRNNVYLISIGLISVIILDLAIEVVIFRLKRNFININHILVSIFLSMFTVLGLIFIKGEYIFQTLFSALILVLVAYILRLKIKDIFVVYILFIVSATFLINNIYILLGLLPIAIIFAMQDDAAVNLISKFFFRNALANNKEQSKKVVFKKQNTFTKQPPKKSKSSKKRSK